MMDFWMYGDDDDDYGYEPHNLLSEEAAKWVGCEVYGDTWTTYIDALVQAPAGHGCVFLRADGDEGVTSLCDGRAEHVEAIREAQSWWHEQGYMVEWVWDWYHGDTPFSDGSDYHAAAYPEPTPDDNVIWASRRFRSKLYYTRQGYVWMHDPTQWRYYYHADPHGWDRWQDSWNDASTLWTWQTWGGGYTLERLHRGSGVLEQSSVTGRVGAAKARGIIAKRRGRWHVANRHILLRKMSDKGVMPLSDDAQERCKARARALANRPPTRRAG